MDQTCYYCGTTGGTMAVTMQGNYHHVECDRRFHAAQKWLRENKPQAHSAAVEVVMRVASGDTDVIAALMGILLVEPDNLAAVMAASQRDWQCMEPVRDLTELTGRERASLWIDNETAQMRERGI